MALFDELLVKIAQNEPLSPSELGELRQAARAMEETKNAVKSWLQPGTTDPKFNYFRADGGEFVEPPVSGGMLEFVGDVPQVISNNTETDVTFQQIFGKPRSYRVEGDKIYTLVPGKFYLFSGLVQWEASGTGRREAQISAYDQNDVLQWGQPLHSFSPDGAAVDYLPFSCPLGITFDNAYLKFSVYQNSGGDLDLQYVILGIFEMSYGFGQTI